LIFRIDKGEDYITYGVILSLYSPFWLRLIIRKDWY
jgi:hypothetical protein